MRPQAGLLVLLTTLLASAGVPGSVGGGFTRDGKTFGVKISPPPGTAACRFVLTGFEVVSGRAVRARKLAENAHRGASPAWAVFSPLPALGGTKTAKYVYVRAAHTCGGTKTYTRPGRVDTSRARGGETAGDVSAWLRAIAGKGSVRHPGLAPGGGTGTEAGAAAPGLDGILDDMSAPHEASLSGVPASYDWGTKPRTGMGNNPRNFSALIPWGQIYREQGAAIPANTRVEIRDLKAYVLKKSTGKWEKLRSSTGVSGGAYTENFAGDVNVKPDSRKEPSGTTSVKLTAGYNYHFWSPEGRVTINPGDVGGVLTVFDARLIPNDPKAPDDRASARILAGAGADYWLDLKAPWDNFKTNGDVAIGRMKFVKNEWRSYGMFTVSKESLRSNPPPR